VVERTRIAGIELEPGSTILLVLAAANRDPSANSCPHEFRLDRPDRCVFSFSRGAHACPGETLAQGIAAAALPVLFETLGSNWLGRLTWVRRPSANGRLPVFQPG
jgi:cytochrome P450